jgi:arginine/ornithine transport system substrate-binding protein
MDTRNVQAHRRRLRVHSDGLQGVDTLVAPRQVRRAGLADQSVAGAQGKALFTIPIVYNPDTYVVPASSHYEFTEEGLKKVRLGLQRGGADLLYIQRVFGDGLPITLYDNPDQIRLDLLAKRIDATFGAKINWTLELINKPEGKDWKLDGGDHWVGDPSVPEDERGLSWIVRKDAAGEVLLKRMNIALDSMIKDCTLTKIRQKYLQISVLKAEAPCVGKP